MELSIKELGQYLRNLREVLGYSTYDVNKLCDISPSYLSLMENGKRKPSAIILKKLAPIYNVNYVELYEKAGYIDLAEKERLSINSNNNTEYVIDTKGLTEDEIESVKRYVEFIKNERKNETK